MAKERRSKRQPPTVKKTFHIEFKNAAQKLAYDIYQNHDIIFMLGPAGTGKTHLATAFALQEILAKTKRKLVLTRPIVEAGEKLGFLPGEFAEKVHPYMMPIYEMIYKMCGDKNATREFIDRNTEVAPIAFMRGRDFEDSVCVLDEAQNATFDQLKLFLTRMGEGSKMVITGDPLQSDLFQDQVALSNVASKLSSVRRIGIIRFKESSIVRHPLIAKILKLLEA